MSSFVTRELDELAFIDKEQLNSSTDSDYEFYYVDISSVATNEINLPIHPIQFKGSPSRARKLLHNGDILMSTVRPNLKAFAIFETPTTRNYIASTGFAVLSQKGGTSLDYIFYSLFSDSVERQIEALVVGSNYPAINTADVRKLKINIPIDVTEQRKIARILSTADAVIEKTRDTIAKYKAIKQGMLFDLFTRGIDHNTGTLRPQPEDAPDLYQDSPLGKMPKDWKNEKLGEVSFITKLAGFEYTIYFDYSKSGPVIAVRALNIKQGKLSLENVHTIPKHTSDLLPRSQLEKGDLVISYVGTVGQVAVIPESNRFHLAPNVAKIAPNKKEVNPFYLNQFLNAEIGQKEIIKLVSSTTQSALSMQNLRELRFIKPMIEEQNLIAERLEMIDSKIQIEQTYLAKLQSIKAGLMADLLSGKKPVKIETAVVEKEYA